MDLIQSSIQYCLGYPVPSLISRFFFSANKIHVELKWYNFFSEGLHKSDFSQRLNIMRWPLVPTPMLGNRSYRDWW